LSPLYRLFAIDLDDTLLGPDHRISPRNADAIAALRGENVIVVIASGRMYETSLPFVRQLELDTPVICYNGAMVKHPGTGDVWLAAQAPADIADEVRDFADRNGYQLNYYMPGHLYTKADTEWSQLYHRRTGASMEVLPDFTRALHGTTPIKMIIVDSPQKTDELLPQMRERYAGKLYVTKSNDEYLEFLPLNVSKGRALAVVAGRYGVPQPETMAIGDSWNDIPMLEWAGLGVAVGNAKPDVKAAAKRIVATNAEDGVADAIRQVFGIETPALT
jgi:Cof subfamily protein (haloacid dehalogenase superfamily)